MNAQAERSASTLRRHGSVTPARSKGEAAFRSWWWRTTSRWGPTVVVSFLILFLAVVIFEPYGDMAGGAPAFDIQQVLQRLEAQEAALRDQQTQLANLGNQLADAARRVATAEEERSIALKLAANAGGKGDGLVDTKGIGQPFKFNGKADQDFAEWVHKFKTFIKAKYGSQLDAPMSWAVKQRKTIVERAVNTTREVGWSPEYGPDADEIDKITDLDSMLDGLFAYLTSFTTGEANKVIRNSGTDGLEAWRRLNAEYDPSSAMRRVVILGQVQHPNKRKSVEELGSCLETWLSRKRQYEEFTDQDGNPCKVSDDSLLAGLFQLMPSSLEEAVVFSADELTSFEALFDRLSSFVTTRHSLQLSRRDLGGGGSSKKDPNAMDIGSLSKSKGKGKKGKDKGGGKGSKDGANKMTICYKCGKPGHKAAECRSTGVGKGAKRMDNVQCWVCWQYGHYGKDCKSKGKGKSGGKDGKKGGHTSSVDNPPNASTTNQPEKEPELGYLDLCPLSCHEDSGDDSRRSRSLRRTCSPSRSRALGSADAGGYAVEEENKPDYVIKKDGETWLKMNYDSGAVSTVVPIEFVEDEVNLERVGDFRVANGDRIPRYGRVRVPCVDESGHRRAFKATVTHVHKPLGSAGEFSKTHDGYLFTDGGYLNPRSSWVAVKMRETLEQLLKTYQDTTVMKLHKEGNLYNIYLRRRGPAQEVSALDSDSSSGQEATVPTGQRSSPPLRRPWFPNARQGQNP